MSLILLCRTFMDEIVRDIKDVAVTISDTIQQRGDCVLKYITQALLNRFDAVIAFILDTHPRNFFMKLNNEHRLYCHDGFTDPLKWNANNSVDSKSLKAPYYLRSGLAELTQRNETLGQKTAEPKKVGVVINSLSSLLSHQDVTFLCRDVLEVMKWKTQDCEVVQTVALLHRDLHDDNILSSLNYLASTVIELQRKTNIKGESDGHFNIIHCKRSGKIQRKTEGYKVVEQDIQLKIFPLSDNEPKGQVEVEASETPDVTSDLTFNLTLTEQQKNARANLQLPYLLNEQTRKTQLDLGKKSQIFYQADEADDLDEEDPDDDLNF